MKRIGFLFVVCQFLLISFAQGAGFPENYQMDSHYRVGVIDRVDLPKGKLIVNDSVYTISDQLKVYSVTSAKTSSGRLFKGSKIGFRLSHPTGNNIEEIWLLPSYFRESRGEP